MAGAPILAPSARTGGLAHRQAHPAVRVVLIGLTVTFLSLFIVLPVANVFTQALS